MKNPNHVAVGDKIMLTKDITGYNLSKGHIYTVIELNSNKYPIIQPLAYPLKLRLLAGEYVKIQESNTMINTIILNRDVAKNWFDHRKSFLVNTRTPPNCYEKDTADLFNALKEIFEPEPLEARKAREYLEGLGYKVDKPL